MSCADRLGATCKPGHLVPTVVIEQATIELEDRRHETPLRLQLSDVNLTIINDPLETITLDGEGRSDLLGKIALRGILKRPVPPSHIDTGR